MRAFIYCFFFSLLCLVFACKDKKQLPPSSGGTGLATSRADTCHLESMADVPNINRHIDFIAQERVFLRPDEEDNWLVEVYHLYTCQRKAMYAIPPNEPAEAPYYLANLNYNNAHRQLAIRGTRSFYLLDLSAGQLSEAITPSFPEELLSDASSGMIRHLEVWENYLVGALSDGACFVYELSDKGTKIVEAAAVYTSKGAVPQALFLIPNDTGHYQAILPTLNGSESGFEVRPVFDHPLLLDTTALIYAAGSPYLRIKERGGNTIGIDMRNATLLPQIEQKTAN